MPYQNKDGLWIFFPGDDREAHGGEYPAAGSLRVIEVEFDAADLSATPLAISPQIIIIPRNHVIQEVEVLSETAFVGGTSLTVGLQHLDGTTYDVDGLVAALPIANLNVNGEDNKLTAGVTYAGALVGTETAYPGTVVVSAAGTFTAGHGVVRIKGYVKDVDQNPTQFNP